MVDYLKPELDRLDKLIQQARESLSDPQLKILAEEEIVILENQKKALIDSKNIPPRGGNISPRGENHNEPEGNVILEIRPGTGGEEAKLFSQDLENMYTRFALAQKMDVIKLDDGVIKIKSKKAYTFFQNEAGVHRVQRVPITEAQGRIHTSTATVSVLPEIKESEININPNDLGITFFHASSHGGQNVQKVSTAVRILHKPTGLITTCQSQRFQEQNRKICLDLLRSKLFQLEKERIASQIGQARQLAGHGMRSEKIRTYNFPQNRITDHRLGKSWKNLDRAIQGDLMPILSEFTRPLPEAQL